MLSNTKPIKLLSPIFAGKAALFDYDTLEFWERNASTTCASSNKCVLKWSVAC
jgi:hypothetical protein